MARILIGVTGSVATIKLIHLAQSLYSFGCSMGIAVECCIVSTMNAKHFVPPGSLCNGSTIPAITDSSLPPPKQYLQLDESKPKFIPFYTDEDEWNLWEKITDPILHIELSKWADIVLIAPLDANTLAKVANGICDNLLLCILRALPMPSTAHDGTISPKSFPQVFLCPAMNTAMWNSPWTDHHLRMIKSGPLSANFSVTIIPPIEKKLACNTFGMGAMATSEVIASAIFQTIKSVQL